MKKKNEQYDYEGDTTEEQVDLSPQRAEAMLDETLQEAKDDAYDFGFISQDIQPIEATYSSACDRLSAEAKKSIEAYLKSERATKRSEKQKRDSKSHEDHVKTAENKFRSEYEEDVAELEGEKAALNQEKIETFKEIGSQKKKLKKCEDKLNSVKLWLIGFVLVFVIGLGVFDGYNLGEFLRSNLGFTTKEATFLGFFLALAILFSAEVFVIWKEKGNKLYATLALFGGLVPLGFILVARVYYFDIVGIISSAIMICFYPLEIVALHYLEAGREARVIKKNIKRLNEKLRNILIAIKEVEGAIKARKARLISDSNELADKWFSGLDTEIFLHEENIANAVKASSQITIDFKNKKTAGLAEIKMSYQQGVAARDDLDLDDLFTTD